MRVAVLLNYWTVIPSVYELPWIGKILVARLRKFSGRHPVDGPQGNGEPDHDTYSS